MEMQAEMDAAVAEWDATCGRKDDADEVKLGAFAESIRYQFGPKLATGGSGKPFLFNAGNDMIFTDPYLLKKKRNAQQMKKKKMTRVNALRAEKSDSCNTATPWCESDHGHLALLRARFGV